MGLRRCIKSGELIVVTSMIKIVPASFAESYRIGGRHYFHLIEVVS
jgi:hypothetical protein